MAIKDHTARRAGSIPVGDYPEPDQFIDARRAATETQSRGQNYPAARREGSPSPVRVKPGGSVGTTTSNPATPHGNG